MTWQQIEENLLRAIEWDLSHSRNIKAALYDLDRLKEFRKDMAKGGRGRSYRLAVWTENLQRIW